MNEIGQELTELDVETLRKDIATSKGILESYRMYGQSVVDAINAFNRLDEVLADPTTENVAEGLEIATKMNSMLGPYKSFVPQIASTLKGVIEWLQEKS